MRISDWSSDVCSSDLDVVGHDASVAPGQPCHQVPPVVAPRRIAVDHHHHLAVARAFVQVRHGNAGPHLEASRRERVVGEFHRGHRHEKGRTNRPWRGSGRRPYQTTSAIEQFSPEPMPSNATRSPFFSRPISRSLLSTIGTEAGPMLPCSPKMVRTFFGSMPMALTKAAVCTLLTWWMTNSSISSTTQPRATRTRSEEIGRAHV